MPVLIEPRRLPALRRPARGVSLIEVLIAMLVLAIGLLGLAALQAQGLRFSNDALVRTQATALASDLLDRMRANRDNAADYAAADLATIFAGADPNARRCASTVSVANDLLCWSEDIKAALPAPDTPIISGRAGTGYYDVVLRWADRDARPFADGTHIPRTQDQCLYPDADTSQPPLPARFWTGTRCMIEQRWTFWP